MLDGPPATGLDYRFYQTPQSSPSPGPQPTLSLRRAKRAKRARGGKKRRASEVEGLEESTRRTKYRPRSLEDTKAMESPHELLPAPSNQQVEVWVSNVREGPPPPYSSHDFDSRGPLGSSLTSEFMHQRFAPRFISSRGNEYFCEIDEDYLTDRFNLTGLQTEVQYYQYALDLVTDVFDLDCDDEMRETIEKSARHLYGLVHARYIVTTRGLAKMLEKYKKADFGKCPRVMCKSHPLLPMGQSDNPNIKAVKLYCSRCEDIYNPKSSRHSAIDGAYFGTSFHNILFQVYPAMIPAKSYDRYVPRIYGFKVHAPAALIRWQNGERDEMRRRLRKLDIDSGFKDEDGEEVEESEDDDDDDEDLEGLDKELVENGVQPEGVPNVGRY
ncbi:putative casein kinase ii beta subunit protein [Botrytis fragariae]|uniref:Casein kinase II subunit beta n=1 Tax=Botrytis fragariae TaxID=1964551 RepID=A0A8H6AMN5_9HELO|nr:putative casein kinase ii beta subunit protein [Botrytis fragariae]KAF5870055.1 putative casein kinase ii beta subunit protein [Botrytis fragariae]